MEEDLKMKVAGREFKEHSCVFAVIKYYNRKGKIKSVYTDRENKLEAIENIINFEVKNVYKADKLIKKFKKLGYVKFQLERDSSGNVYKNKVIMELYV